MRILHQKNTQNTGIAPQVQSANCKRQTQYAPRIHTIGTAPYDGGAAPQAKSPWFPPPPQLGYARSSPKEKHMAQRLHLVFGGELVDPARTEFKDVNNVHVVGIFPDYASAHAAWKAEAQRTVDSAHTRYFIAHLHRLRDEEREGSLTEALIN